MAQKVTVALEDDLDGGLADETVWFGVDGTDYEIDLSATNARAFRTKLAPFIERARTLACGTARRPGRTAAGRQRTADARAWAKEHGNRGQRSRPDPSSVLEHYQAAIKEAEPHGRTPSKLIRFREQIACRERARNSDVERWPYQSAGGAMPGSVPQ